MNSTALEQPVALVVEDKQRSRERRIELLQSHGFTVFSAASARRALQEVRSVPSIDLVVTDINLDPSSSSDRSGVNLARAIRAQDSSIPIIGYSAAFSEGDLEPGEVEAFDDYLPKGAFRPHELSEHVDDWLRRAEHHRDERIAWARAELRRLREKYGSPNPDFSTIRLLSLESGAEVQGEELTTEQTLRKVGYRLRIIEPGTYRPRLSDPSSKIVSPLLVWSKQENDTTVVEVYGYPELYAFGDTEKDALKEILLLMDGFYQELVVDAPGDDSLSAPLHRLRDFLKHVFG